MSPVQYGSFEIQSPIMKSIISVLENHTDKKFFIVVGDTGTGKSTMLNFINKVIFQNNQKNLIEDFSHFRADMTSAIITTPKETAYEIIKNFDKAQTHIVEMPALSERKADIAAFAHFFIQVLSLMNNKKAHKLADKAVEKLLQHNWPGNFYELESVLEQAFDNSLQLENKYVIEPEHIVLNASAAEPVFSVGQKLDEVERKYILQTLYFVHQNRTKAAEILGISIRTLRNKINQYREEGFL